MPKSHVDLEVEVRQVNGQFLKGIIVKENDDSSKFLVKYYESSNQAWEVFIPDNFKFGKKQNSNKKSSVDPIQNIFLEKNFLLSTFKMPDLFTKDTSNNENDNIDCNLGNSKNKQKKKITNFYWFFKYNSNFKGKYLQKRSSCFK